MVQLNILFDGDIELYRAISEEVYIWAEDLHTLVSDAKESRQRMEVNIKKTQKLLEDWLETSLNVILCFSDNENWRKSLYPRYKANRTLQRRPIAFKAVKEWFIKNYNSKVWPRLEADDVLGILGTSDFNDNIIVSADKDLKCIPGWLFNPDKDTTPKLISLQEADHFHIWQALTGDNVDGYPGCPSVGPVAAYKALGKPGQYTLPELWERLISLYKRSGRSPEEALVQAKMARILRKDEWDFEKKECLWQPPSLL